MIFSVEEASKYLNEKAGNINFFRKKLRERNFINSREYLSNQHLEWFQEVRKLKESHAHMTWDDAIEKVLDKKVWSTKYVDLVLLRFNQNDKFTGDFNEHLNYSIVPIGVSHMGKEHIGKLSPNCLIGIIFTDKSGASSRKFFLSKLHDLFNTQDSELPNEIKVFQPSYYSYDKQVSTILIVKELSQVSEDEFKLFLLSYDRFIRKTDVNNNPIKFKYADIYASQTSKYYLSKTGISSNINNTQLKDDNILVNETITI